MSFGVYINGFRAKTHIGANTGTRPRLTKPNIAKFRNNVFQKVRSLLCFLDY